MGQPLSDPFGDWISMKKIAVLFLIAACGDNLIPSPDSGSYVPPTTGGLDLPTDGFDYCPDTDEPATPTPEAARAACCVGLQNGNVPIECGPPPGLARRCRLTRCGDGFALDTCR